MELEGRDPTINTPPHLSLHQTEFMRKSGSGSGSVGIGWEDLTLPSVEDPRDCVDPRHLGQSEWDQKLGQSVYFHCMIRWDGNEMMSIYSGVGRIYSPSLYAPPLPLYFRTPAVAPWRFTWKLWSSEFGDALGGRDRANLEAGIERIWRYTWRPWWSELRDALRDRDRASLKIHLEAVTKQVWRPSSCEFRDTLGGCDRASLEMHLEARIERDWRSTRRR